MTDRDREPTLADVQAQYPSWRCWRATSGLCHARPAAARPADDAPLLTGEDALDLRDEIRRAEAPW
jgi:hypothetical protein